MGEGRRRDGVVDVVEAGERELHAARLALQLQVEGDSVECAELDVARHDVQRRPCDVPVRAAVVTEVADVRRGVLERLTAAQAVLRVGGVLERGPRDARVVKPEDERGGVRGREITDERVVPVDHQGRAGPQRAHGVAPALGDELELAVAVELVSEEVPEADGARPDAAHHLRQGCLVHLEEAELGIAGGEERGGDTGEEVRARAVVGEPDARAEDLRCHRGGRRLPVRGGDRRRPGGEPSGQAIDRSRIEDGEELARDGRASAGADEARESGDRPRGGDLGGERDGHACESIAARIHLRILQPDLPYL